MSCLVFPGEVFFFLEICLSAFHIRIWTFVVLHSLYHNIACNLILRNFVTMCVHQTKVKSLQVFETIKLVFVSMKKIMKK